MRVVGGIRGNPRGALSAHANKTRQNQHVLYWKMVPTLQSSSPKPSLELKLSFGSALCGRKLPHSPSREHNNKKGAESGQTGGGVPFANAQIQSESEPVYTYTDVRPGGDSKRKPHTDNCASCSLGGHIPVSQKLRWCGVIGRSSHAELSRGFGRTVERPRLSIKHTVVIVPGNW